MFNFPSGVNVMIKTFLFDLGNVLLFFSHEKMYDQLGALCGKSGTEMESLISHHRIDVAFDRGELTESAFHQWLQAQTAVRFSKEELEVASSDIFELNKSMVPILDQLKSKGFRLVLLSNTNCTHIHYVRQHFEILDCFDQLVLSYEVGAVKPEPEMYQKALQQIDCQPGECFYTDDIHDFVEQGREHGLVAELFTTTEAFVEQIRALGIDLPE